MSKTHYDKCGCKVLLGEKENTSEARSGEINLHGDEEQSQPPPSPPPHAIYLQPKQDRVNSSDAMERKHDNTAYKAEQIVSKKKKNALKSFFSLRLLSPFRKCKQGLLQIHISYLSDNYLD